MSKPENPQAFPVESDITQHPGMTLRDYFAGQALVVYIGRNSNYTLAGHQSPAWPEEIAKACYEMADAMLAERSK